MSNETKEKSVTILQSRYEDLLAREERLRMIEIALAGTSGYTDITLIKKIFGIKEDKAE